MQTGRPSNDVSTSQILPWARLLEAVHKVEDFSLQGSVVQMVGLTIESEGPSVTLGEVCAIHRLGRPPVLAEVVGFRQRRVLMMPLGEPDGIGPGSLVTAYRRPLTVPVGPALLGRVLNGLGEPIDGREPIRPVARYPLMSTPPDPLRRPRIQAPLAVGVRAIDGLLTIGRGQRIGIFAGSGVGKSTLLGMMARQTEADVCCIALIGERGREVREFLEKDLGPEGLARSVVVVATSDQPALVRLKGAFVATAIAEYFRDRGAHVLLMMDSVTRFAMAQREIGLAAGEPPATRGYPPSVFALLPRLLERAGMSASGSITGIYTVLVDGDDFNEPIADAARSILDGHIVLSRTLAQRGHYPAIDVLSSVSRVMGDIVDGAQLQAAARFKRWLATYQEVQDLIEIGAYAAGSNPEVDEAIARRPELLRFLRQDVNELSDWSSTRAWLIELAGEQK
ncbi:MAG: flagellar protein export ATPase FliI [Limnochordales bacterium]|nr:flagellar protein export ATPase FliI [Limnochordales bacterium]